MPGGPMLSPRAPWTAVCLVAFFCFLVPTLLPAQGTGGRILGRVTDPSGAVVTGAKVSAINEATGVARDTNTSDSGDYVFPDLPVGTYTLTFEGTGFKKDVRKGVSLD